MKTPWFKRFGILFIPATFMGWLILLAGIAYAVYIFIKIDSKSHSVSDTLMSFVINLIIIITLYSLVAFISSRTTKTKFTSNEK